MKVKTSKIFKLTIKLKSICENIKINRENHKRETIMKINNTII